MRGEYAYNKSIARLPNFSDGTPRPSWYDLPLKQRKGWMDAGNPKKQVYDKGILTNEEAGYDYKLNLRRSLIMSAGLPRNHRQL